MKEGEKLLIIEISAAGSLQIIGLLHNHKLFFSKSVRNAPICAIMQL
jgi:hypothetical protein